MPSDEVGVNDKVMVISNENEPVMVGHVVDFETWGNPQQTPIPVVVEEGTGKQFVCFGIIKKFDPELKAELDSMHYKDRWNSLAWNKME